ncbi:hypothetical protein CEXT_754481 [Caerostris extrusa]|uniref:Uncharacterized protein n=1 Tax=Caerostris extrusa TaxID=172846 RepID=A0AAV4UZ87_CAEEX|nr:hypothetical protein CEXT_754481 [Caerostris extrusa]
MTATFNRSSGQTCSELQLVHVGKCFWPLLKERHLMCHFKYTIGVLDDSRWWSSLDEVVLHQLEPRWGELEEFSITADLKFFSWSRSLRRSKSHLILVHQRFLPWSKDQ